MRDAGARGTAKNAIISWLGTLVSSLLERAAHGEHLFFFRSPHFLNTRIIKV
jgi:hypothetical protein